jgi:hypothetical protein
MKSIVPSLVRLASFVAAAGITALTFGVHGADWSALGGPAYQSAPTATTVASTAQPVPARIVVAVVGTR